MRTKKQRMATMIARTAKMKRTRSKSPAVIRTQRTRARVYVGSDRTPTWLASQSSRAEYNLHYADRIEIGRLIEVMKLKMGSPAENVTPYQLPPLKDLQVCSQPRSARHLRSWATSTYAEYTLPECLDHGELGGRQYPSACCLLRLTSFPRDPS